MQAFKKIDADHGGSLDAQEMKAAFFEVAGSRWADGGRDGSGPC
jgi:hypothetical protein